MDRILSFLLLEVVYVFHVVRENVDTQFNDIYKEAKYIATKYNIEPTMPRVCSSYKK